MSPAKKVPIIMSVVSNEYRVPISELTTPNQTGHVTRSTEAKYVAMYLVRQWTYFSMSYIGDLFGYKKCSKGPDWVEAKLLTDADFKRRVLKLEAILPEIFNIHK